MSKYHDMRKHIAQMKDRRFYFYLGERPVHVYILKDSPAEVEPERHGYNVKWDYRSLFECSLCGWGCYDTFTGDTDTYQYCPNCGAKMDAEIPIKEEKR